MTNLEYFDYVMERIEQSQIGKIMTLPELRREEKEFFGKMWKLMDENDEVWFYGVNVKEVK